MFRKDLPNRSVRSIINKQAPFPCSDHCNPRLKPEGGRRDPADIKLLRHSKRPFTRIYIHADKERLVTVIYIYPVLLRRPYHLSCQRISDLSGICGLSVPVHKTEAAVLKHKRHTIFQNDRAGHISFCPRIILTGRSVPRVRRVQRRILIFRHSSCSVIY